MFTARTECRDATHRRSRTDHSMLIIAMIRVRLATECLQAESIMGYPPITRRSRGDNRNTLALICDVRHHYPEHMWPLSSIARRRRFDRRHLLAHDGRPPAREPHRPTRAEHRPRLAGLSPALVERPAAGFRLPASECLLQSACKSPAERTPPARRTRYEALGIPEGSIHYEWRSPVGWRIVVHVRSTIWQTARREPEKASRRT